MRIKALIFILSASAFLYFQVDSQEIGFIEKSKGMAAKFYEEQKELLKRGDIVSQNENIITEGNGFARIRFIDNDGFLTVGGESSVSVSLYKSDSLYEKAFTLNYGALYASAKNLTRISSKNAVILFDSSDIYIENRDDILTVYCILGNVKVESAWGEANLYAGEECHVLSDMTPYKKTSAQKRDDISEIESSSEIIEIEMENAEGKKKNIILEVE